MQPIQNEINQEFSVQDLYNPQDNQSDQNTKSCDSQIDW